MVVGDFGVIGVLAPPHAEKDDSLGCGCVIALCLKTVDQFALQIIRLYRLLMLMVEQKRFPRKSVLSKNAQVLDSHE